MLAEELVNNYAAFLNEPANIELIVPEATADGKEPIEEKEVEDVESED